MRSREAGHTLIELTVATLFLGLLILLVMPSLQGYQSNAQVRSLAELAVSQYRQLETTAEAENTTISWSVYGNGSQSPQQWVARQNGSTLSSTTVPGTLDLTGCYLDFVRADGSVSMAGPCVGNPAAWVNGALIVACVDNKSASAPFSLELTAYPATGQVVVRQIATLCPDI
jgi:type II secretory pathway pseudopilin PulG